MGVFILLFSSPSLPPLPTPAFSSQPSSAPHLLPLSVIHLQVLEVVRNNYDTLTLKLQDGLDYFEKYSERPKESGFFAQLVSCMHVVGWAGSRVGDGVGWAG